MPKVSQAENTGNLLTAHNFSQDLVEVGNGSKMGTYSAGKHVNTNSVPVLWPALHLLTVFRGPLHCRQTLLVALI